VTDNAGSLTVDQATGTNLHTVVDSGTITANLGTIADVATQTTLSTLNGKVTACDTGSVTIGAALPAGSAKLGGVDLDSDATPAAAVPGTAQYVCGVDGSGDARGLSTDTAGQLQVDVATLPSVTIGTFPDNEPFNIAQYGGSAVSATNPVFTAPVPTTAGGCLIEHLISAATTNATNAKSSAGQLYGWSITNTNASARYVKLHNTAGTPTAGTGVVFTIGVPAASGSNFELTSGITFATGIAFTTVTGIADNDTTAVGASDLNINLFYK
jgi:hypothetical protein